MEEAGSAGWRRSYSIYLAGCRPEAFAFISDPITCIWIWYGALTPRGSLNCSAPNFQHSTTQQVIYLGNVV